MDDVGVDPQRSDQVEPFGIHTEHIGWARRIAGAGQDGQVATEAGSDLIRQTGGVTRERSDGTASSSLASTVPA